MKKEIKNMKWSDFDLKKDEKPLDHLVENGGFARVFRELMVIGDSLSSGEFQSFENGVTGYHDFPEYSWGQYLARASGIAIDDCSAGGMTSEWWYNSFANENHFWDKRPQGYIVMLGANDLGLAHTPLGSIEDIHVSDSFLNAPTFAGNYAKILTKCHYLQPKGYLFLATMPHFEGWEDINSIADPHAELIRQIAKLYPHCYVLDFNKYCPMVPKTTLKKLAMDGHLTPAGYMLMGELIGSYLDYLVRQDPEQFAQVGFIGTPYSNSHAKE
jgi:lysophospholipase L1-like esterase